MRIGGMEIRRVLAEPKTRPPDLGKEFGHIGTKNFQGILYGIDYNKDWASGYGSKKWKTIDEMRMSDGQIKGTLRYCKEPILAADWSVEPAGDDNRSQEIADLVTWNLMEGMTTTWRYTLRHLLLALDFGFMVLEKVWQYDRNTGRIYCAKLAPRMPDTIYKWNPDADGNLESVEQMVSYNDVRPMPAEKIIHFAIEQEGGNYEGTSLLRSAYKHWKMKLAFEKIAAMSYERYGMGLMVFKEPVDASKEDRSRADDIGEKARYHESGYLRLPFGWELDVVFGEGWRSPDKEIRYHNEMISAGILQQFVNLGTMERGSRAVGEVLADPYYLSLESLAAQIAETLNASLVRELVDYNFAAVEEYPKVKFSNIAAQDFSMVAEALSKLAQFGFIMPDDDIETHLRQSMRLPERKEEGQRRPMPKPDEQTGEAVEAGDIPLGVELMAGRKLFPWERTVNFAEIERYMDRKVKELVSDLMPVREQQIEKLSDEVAEMVIAEERIDPNKIKVGYWGKMADIVKKHMRDAYDFGQDQVAEELWKQKAREVLTRRRKGEFQEEEELERLIQTTADELVNSNNQQLQQSAINQAAVEAKKQGLLGKQTKKQVKKRIKGKLKELKTGRTVGLHANGAVNEAVAEGRRDFAENHADDYARAYRSGVLDTNICPHCKPLDGKEFSVSQALKVELPDPACYGGKYRCRCMMVYISKEEQEAVM